MSFAKILILLQFIILLLPNFSSSSVPKFFIRNAKIDSTNSTNTTNVCNSRLSESALKLIWKLMTDKITHVIDLHVWIESVNNTMNNTQKQIRIKWANEIGRTLISLIAQAETLNHRMMIPLSYTSTLQAGIYSMNIFIAKEVMQCFFSKKNTSDHAIFDLLVQELYHISESKTDYKLCLPHSDSFQYNCCTIAGRNDLLICTDYSSVVTKTISSLVYGAFFCVSFLALVVPTEIIKRRHNKNYRISSSPMSLSSVLLSVFFEKQGPVISTGRKLLLTIFVLLITFSKWGTHSRWMYVFLFILWIFFLFTNVIYLKNSQSQKYSKNSESLIKVFTFPLDLMFFWGKFERLARTLKIQMQSQDDDDNDDEEEEEKEEDAHADKKRPFFTPLKYLIVFLIFLVFYIINMPLLYLLSIFTLIKKNVAVAQLFHIHRMCWNGTTERHNRTAQQNGTTERHNRTAQQNGTTERHYRTARRNYLSDVNHSLFLFGRFFVFNSVLHTKHALPSILFHHWFVYERGNFQSLYSAFVHHYILFLDQLEIFG